jgi:transposase
MKLHANAHTCPRCRSLIVSRVMGGHMPAAVARDFRVSTRTVFKWVARRDSGFNRTTWRLADLHSALLAQGVSTTRNNLSAVIKQAGYQWKRHGSR